MHLPLGRLKCRADFLRVASAQKKWAEPGLVLQAARWKKSDGIKAPLRIGFTCSKKVGNAVSRNRAKRRLRAAAKEILGNLAVTNADYVLIGRKETLRRPYLLLLQDVKTALKRLGMMRSDGERK